MRVPLRYVPPLPPPRCPSPYAPLPHNCQVKVAWKSYFALASVAWLINGVNLISHQTGCAVTQGFCKNTEISMTIIMYQTFCYSALRIAHTFSLQSSKQVVRQANTVILRLQVGVQMKRWYVAESHPVQSWWR